jgi:hypothetical protein
VTHLLTAASHPTGGGAAGLILLALLALVAYIAACVIWPFGACRKCAGLGRFRSPTGRAWRACKHCRGTGARVRAGRRIWDVLRGVRDRANH